MKDLNPGFPKDQHQHKTIVKAEVKWPDVLSSNVRQLARSNYTWFRFHPYESDWALLSSSSPESSVFGKITLIINGQKTFVPFATTFLFTCLRSTKLNNEITWSMSLS